MELGIYHWVNIFIPDVGAMPEDSVGHLGQDGVGREEASDLRFDLRDLALQQLVAFFSRIVPYFGGRRRRTRNLSFSFRASLFSRCTVQ